MKKQIYRCYKAIRRPFGILRRFINRKIADRKAVHEAIVLECFMTRTQGHKRLFYLGKTENNNLGDNAQHYCITQWIKENYKDRDVYVTPSSFVTHKSRKWLRVFVEHFNNNSDIIIFQSGYCTQDLGGDHPLMHELICKYLPEAKILMMPQTIFFKNEENRKRTSRNHDNAKNMLFLARDRVSYEQALTMFPHIRVKLFPDIVTTLIGKYRFSTPRTKIFMCCRNDGEKLYSDKELKVLRTRLESLCTVDFGDTQSKLSGDKLRKMLSKALTKEFEMMSHYKVVITDRYHGTIFSLIANTPVIIIKSTDHKVTTGADWFKGVYDDYVYVAKDLEDAYNRAEAICRHFDYKVLPPYFNEHYYKHLKEIFEESK